MQYVVVISALAIFITAISVLQIPPVYSGVLART